MAGSLNKVQLIGNLGKDPEIRATQAGNKIANLSVATSESWKDKQSGEKRERTEWHRVVIFNPHLAEVAEKYLAKGAKVFLEGQLQTRKWTDQQGVEKFATEVVLQQFGGTLILLGGGKPSESGGQTQGAKSAPAAAGGRGGADLDDDIPF